MSLTKSNETRYRADSQVILSVLDTPVLTLAQCKNVLHVSHDEDDVFIEKIMAGVERQVERYIRRDIVKKRRKAYWFNHQGIALLPVGPHSTIVSVDVTDVNGVTYEITDYKEAGLEFKRLYDINTAGILEVVYDSGYDIDDRPPEAEAAMLQEVSLQYKNRQDPDSAGFTSHKSLSIEARHLLEGLIRRAL
jgi:hypothetical protein